MHFGVTCGEDVGLFEVPKVNRVWVEGRVLVGKSHGGNRDSDNTLAMVFGLKTRLFQRHSVQHGALVFL